MDQTWKTGLEDVIAARSAICCVDGEAGRLYYRGYEIGDLAASAGFEDVTHLLWFGELPTAAERADFNARLDQSRGLPAEVAALLRSLPRDCHPLDALRTAVSLAAARDPDARSSDEG
ncbi:MAG TPA: citrate/2-methylcitrate synthase, partial [Terriglobales bacterium]|nr:citrate/2-methylcitrate synthase [Terriglobales bacterium]